MTPSCRLFSRSPPLRPSMTSNGSSAPLSSTMSISLPHPTGSHYWARLRLNASKTRVWNAAGARPDAVPQVAPYWAVWVGGTALSPEQRGLVALGVASLLWACPSAVRPSSSRTRNSRSPAIPASSKHLLPYTTPRSAGCSSHAAAPRAQCALRSPPPEATRAFATAHDDAVLAFLDTLLSAGAPSGLPLLATARAQLELRHGGLGLRSAARHAPAAYWSSWADVLPVIASRGPAFARAFVDTLEGGSPAPEVLQSLLLARASLTARKKMFAPPPWPELLTTPAPLPGDEDEEHQNPSSTPPVVDGNALHPGPSTSSSTAPSSASLIPPLPPCWTRRQALLNFHLLLRTSESRCCGASGSLCRSLPLSAAADVARTSSGITSLHAPAPRRARHRNRR